MSSVPCDRLAQLDIGGTADGDAIVVACFESADAARRNSDRPEQEVVGRGREVLHRAADLL